ncbi:MAG TPA: lytic murein transglycosylase [Mycobacteriales bacterium]|nr:lytic murein transglycosylase [Mycobacteriales bacterium]
MTRRGLPSRRGALIATGSPLAIAATLALASTHSGGSAARLDTTVKDVAGPHFPLPPFAATPTVVPLDRTVTVRIRPRHQPPATAKGAALPTTLNVTNEQIPRRVLAAYVNAAMIADRRNPNCGLSWQILAGIGYVESDNARSGGSGAPQWDGEASPHILGPVLDGKGKVAAIPDTDGGRLDGNATWDRAVGPMQFLPSTWAEYAADGNHDGVKDPEQIDDATLAAGDYLCAAGSRLARPLQLIRAVLSYNHSIAYVRDVLTVAAHYQGIDPKKLGIGLLPHRHHKHRGRRHGKHRHGLGKPRLTPTPTPSGGPPTVPLPTPTPTPTDTAVPTPSATGSPSPSATPDPSHSLTPSPSSAPTDTPTDDPSATPTS